MVDLSAPELKLVLWLIHVVNSAYGLEPPSASMVALVQAKLLLELNKEQGCSLPAPSSTPISAL